MAHVPYFGPPLRPGIPLVVTIHDLIPLLLPEYRGALAVQVYMRLVSAAARGAALVITDSQASARDIERVLHIPGGRIRVIYLAASPSFRPQSVADGEATRVKMGVRFPYFLYLGGFDRRKNVTGLLHAYARVREELGGIRLVIAGRLPDRQTNLHPDPRLTIQELGLAHEVLLTGVAEEDKAALYGGAVAFVFPSYYEGFGLPVLEAISCGVPAIVGAGSSLEEVAGEGGLPVAATDTDALAEAMLRLARDAALRDSLAAKGLRHAARFSWQETARRTRSVYLEALAQ